MRVADRRAHAELLPCSGEEGPGETERDLFLDRLCGLRGLQEPTPDDLSFLLFADRVFGPERRSILEADLADADDHATSEREEERARIKRQLAELGGDEKQLQAKIADLDEADLTLPRDDVR
ncbi:hypothetical protein GCM10027598_58050 [Amycolatopsis oliviviridis]|uniref:Uncharacterized protein n=1 Tax=Amycolatopsis oliviviridis TaxID=1471590 RepID=A0ABQ3LYV2_9PSEU|nr:hypothetical protein [Amycolatopsis oliviviridis]GHH28217.1 hypothetical protein GCM10017790_58700 [Amycolatopsis oliviviridis]